jgi:hypothetical protein
MSLDVNDALQIAAEVELVLSEVGRQGRPQNWSVSSDSLTSIVAVFIAWHRGKKWQKPHHAVSILSAVLLMARLPMDSVISQTVTVNRLPK